METYEENMNKGLNCCFEPADIEIYVVKKGLVLKEKSLIAFCMEGNHVRTVGIGNEVMQLDRTQTDATFFSPFHQGKIENYAMAEKILHYMVKKSWGSHFSKPVIGLSVPSSPQVMCEIDMKAYLDAIYQAGAKQVEFIWEAEDKLFTDAAHGEIKAYDMIIRITKDSPMDYVKERAKETLQYAAQYGVSKDELLTLLKTMDV